MLLAKTSLWMLRGSKSIVTNSCVWTHMYISTSTKANTSNNTWQRHSPNAHHQSWYMARTHYSYWHVSYDGLTHYMQTLHNNKHKSILELGRPPFAARRAPASQRSLSLSLPPSLPPSPHYLSITHNICIPIRSSLLTPRTDLPTPKFMWSTDDFVLFLGVSWGSIRSKTPTLRVWVWVPEHLPSLWPRLAPHLTIPPQPSGWKPHSAPASHVSSSEKARHKKEGSHHGLTQPTIPCQHVWTTSY